MTDAIVAVYEYRDETGVLLYASVRFEPKDFRQGQPDGQGGLTWSMTGVRRVPYRLPAVIAAAQAGHVVFVVEGEKDADRLAGLGLVATTNVGGAGRWRPEYAEHLRGAHVVILSDNDAPGQRHAQQVADSLRGITASVRIVELPGLPPKGDVSDWLDQGHDVQELFAAVRGAPASPRAFTIAEHRAAIKHHHLQRKLDRARIKRKREHGADDREWALRVAQAKAIPITQIAALLGLGRPEGSGKEVSVRCPFHDDEHPSMQLNDAKGLWYCGPCGRGGNALGLVMEVKGIGFAAAVREVTAM